MHQQAPVTPQERSTPTSALTAATTKLRQASPAVLDALGLVHCATDLVRIWPRLTQQPAISNQYLLDFYEVLVQLLVARGVLTLGAPPALQAQQVARMLLPPGASHPQADVAALCRAALMLDDQLLLWQQQALALERSLIGGQNTHHELLFPLLHEALEALASGTYIEP